MKRSTLAMTTLLIMGMMGGSTSAVELDDIKDLEDFTKAFNDAEEKPRLVLLLSPT